MDDITFEEFKKIYSELKYKELLALNPEELTSNAQKALSQELEKRKISNNDNQEIEVSKKEIGEYHTQEQENINSNLESPPKSNKITIGFNIIITIIYFFTAGVSGALFKPSNSNIRIEALMDYDPLIGFLILALFMILSLTASLVIIKQIWEKLFMNILNVRNINYAEAYALTMFFSFLLAK